jgi:vitamin B12 transporter
MKKNSTISAFLALMATCAWAQEQDSVKVNPLKEVVISDTKFAQRKEKSGKIIEVISAKDLAQKNRSKFGHCFVASYRCGNQR